MKSQEAERHLLNDEWWLGLPVPSPVAKKPAYVIFLTCSLRIKTIVWVLFSGWVVARIGVCKRSLEHSRNRVWNIRETGSGSFGIDERGSKWHSKNLVPVGSISKDLSIDLRSSTECCHAFPLRYDNICPISEVIRDKIISITCWYALNCTVHRFRFEDSF